MNVHKAEFTEESIAEALDRSLQEDPEILAARIKECEADIERHDATIRDAQTARRKAAEDLAALRRRMIGLMEAV